VKVKEMCERCGKSFDGFMLVAAAVFNCTRHCQQSASLRWAKQEGTSNCFNLL